MADSPMGPWTPDKYAGVIFRNPSVYFGAGGNNHQSVFEFKGEYYFTYHAQTLNRRITGGATQGFRSPHLAKLAFNPDGTIQQVIGDYHGVDKVSDVDPYRVIEAETIAWQQGIATKMIAGASQQFGAQAPNLVVHDIDNGDWTSLASVDFGAAGAASVTARVLPLVAGGAIQLRLDDRTAPVVATIPVDAPLGAWTDLTVPLNGVAGVHDVYFTYAGPDGSNLFEIDSWAFKAAPVVVPTLPVTVSAQARCIGGKAYVAVQARNDHDGVVSLAVETAYGSRSFSDVAPGANAYQSFATRSVSIAAGSATVRATGAISGKAVTTVLTAEYPGINCA
jgi:arabinoxylan arabinofuranohydrolase